MGKPAALSVTLVALFLASLPVVATSCRITSGCGGNCGNLDLHVPFVFDEDFFLCVPSSILMWRLYDGLPTTSKIGIANSVGCNWQYVGCTTQEAVSGVRLFTVTGRDAYLDDYGGIGDPDTLLAEYASREITSMVNGVPVLGIVNGASHAVVITSGNYTTRSDGLKQWDWVYVNDPSDSPGYTKYSAGAWLNISVYHVISNTAKNGWQGNFSTWAPRTTVRGWPHGPFIPQP